MSEPFLAEIRLVPFNFAPRGWAFCSGQILPISPNTALFSLLGTIYGGDGKSTFGLPNLQGLTVLGADGGQFPQGLQGGEEAVTLLQSEMPPHTHQLQVSSAAGATTDPKGATFARPRVGRTPENAYGTGPAIPLAPDTIAPAGGSAPHNNMQPYLVLNYIIATQGIYPPRQ
jgi:microcystin-dependent protein